MIRPAVDPEAKPIVVALVTNFLLSWAALPLVIPPFRVYSLRELMDVLLWQATGAVGWPLAIVGGLAGPILQGKAPNLVALLLVLVYPASLLLLISVLICRRSRRWALFLMHLLLTVSFAAIWYQVLNGYGIMVG
jgi:hypothetical protein